MNETIIAATDGWYLIQPKPDGGTHTDVHRTPIVAWRISERGAIPVPLGASLDPATLTRTGVQNPSGSVWLKGVEHHKMRTFLHAFQRSASTPASAPHRSAAEVTPELEAETVPALPPARLLDPELAEEDRRHAMIELINVHGEEFVLHAHEWTKALALAREHGWTALGTKRDGIAHWEGRYDEPHNQRVRADDAHHFADALERALPTLSAPRSEEAVAAMPASTLLALSPAEYFGGIKGNRYVKALIAFARQGGFRIA